MRLLNLWDDSECVCSQGVRFVRDSMCEHVSVCSRRLGGDASLCLCQQYSEKEDKYEEEIKVLTDKLKEVRS